MTDPGFREFDGRLRRIGRIRRRGGAFEAAGTLGSGRYYARAPQRRSIGRPLLLIVSACILMKAAMMAQIGEADYAARVATLSDGSQVEAVAAHLLQPEPISQAVAGVLVELFKSPI